MSTTWFNENWQHLMGTADSLLDDLRRNAAEVAPNTAVDTLLQQAEQQRTATEQALQYVEQQRQALIHTLDDLQRELAVAGRPLRGEVS